MPALLLKRATVSTGEVYRSTRTALPRADPQGRYAGVRQELEYVMNAKTVSRSQVLLAKSRTDFRVADRSHPKGALRLRRAASLRIGTIGRRVSISDLDGKLET